MQYKVMVLKLLVAILKSVIRHYDEHQDVILDAEIMVSDMER